MFPIPVEVIPDATHLVEEKLALLGATDIQLRYGSGKDGPVITESGNVILDARFPEIPRTLERDIKAVPGVVESGLFIGYRLEVVTPQA